MISFENNDKLFVPEHMPLSLSYSWLGRANYIFFCFVTTKLMLHSSKVWLMVTHSNTLRFFRHVALVTPSPHFLPGLLS